MTERSPSTGPQDANPSTSVNRIELVIALADAVRELTEPQQLVEYVEVAVTEQRLSANSRRRKAKRTRRRRAHTVTFPPLLHALRLAMVPVAAGEAGGRGFESRPSVDLEPTSVLRGIRDDVARYADKLGVEQTTLVVTMRHLVGAQHTDVVLENLAADAAQWVREARLAVGLDAAPITLNAPCPYCWTRHALVLTGDLSAARCTRCGRKWASDTIGLLAQMIVANETRDTLAEPG